MSPTGIQRLWIPGQVPGLNELLAARGVIGKGPRGGHYNGYSSLKRQWCERVVMMAHAQKLRPVQSAWVTYCFFEPDRKRDPSNISAGGIKVIEDGLQAAGVLAGDGWRAILGFAVYWDVDKKNPGTTVFLSQHMVLDRQTALWREQEERVKNGQTRC